MLKIAIGSFLLGWLACIAVAGFRNHVNKTPVEVFTKDGRRIR